MQKLNIFIAILFCAIIVMACQKKVKEDHITIKTSFDEGMTWPKENQLELYEEDTYGYSCLTIVDDEHIGILYEGQKELYFEKISLRELLRKPQ